jgi:hypothetical protein
VASDTADGLVIVDFDGARHFNTRNMITSFPVGVTGEAPAQVEEVDPVAEFYDEITDPDFKADDAGALWNRVAKLFDEWEGARRHQPPAYRLGP